MSSLRVHCRLLSLFMALQSLQCCLSTVHVGHSGPFTVQVDDSGQYPAVTVTETVDAPNETHEVIWATDASKAFLQATYEKQTVEQNGGDFIIKSDPVYLCNDIHYLNFTADDSILMHEIIVTFSLCDKSQFVQLTFKAAVINSYTHLLFNVSITSTIHPVNRLYLRYRSSKEEQFFGGGVQYTYVNLKGQSVPIFTSEQGVGRGLEPVTAILDRFSPGAGMGLLVHTIIVKGI